jgi:hypothetical protein
MRVIIHELVSKEQGVCIINLDDKDRVCSIAKVRES